MNKFIKVTDATTMKPMLLKSDIIIKIYEDEATDNKNIRRIECKDSYCEYVTDTIEELYKSLNS